MVTGRLECERAVEIAAGRRLLHGILTIPDGACGVVAFAHGSGSGRFSQRNQFVARSLQNAGLATLLVDLLDEQEENDRAKVFNIDLLAGRLQAAAEWLRRDPETRSLSLGYFGASSGAAAALVAAAREPELVHAVVSRGGRPDLAENYLPAVRTPVRLIVGGNDVEVLESNKHAFDLLRGPKDLVLVPRATHLFPEPGALEEVARLAKDWFLRYLRVVRTVAKPSAVPMAGNCEKPTPIGEIKTFRDREDAARQLAAKLKGRSLHDPLVLAIPRGGVVTGAALARQLGAELDVVLSRKLRAPDQPELAFGAISEDGQVYLANNARFIMDQSEDSMAEERSHQVREIARRKKLFRAVRPQAPVEGRSVIITDDGIATGSTMIAALQTVRAKRPHDLIVAVPVGSPERLHEIQRLCDDVVCLLCPKSFWAISQFYDDFAPVEDKRVIELLREDAARRQAREHDAR